MINPIKNFNISFKGNESKDNDLGFGEIEAMFKRRDEQRRLEERRLEIRKQVQADSFEHQRPKSRKQTKKKVKLAPIILAGMITLGTPFALKSCGSNAGGTVQENPISTSDIATFETEPAMSDEEFKQMILEQEAFLVEQRLQEVKQAADTIMQTPQLKQTYGDILQTISRMEKTLGEDPIELLKGYLKEDWGKNVELEMVLPQIFFESSGHHYDINSTIGESTPINESSAQCNGYMQMSADATHDMNAKYFTDNPQKRDDPRGNLKLGISYNHYLDKYYEGETFDALAAYNCGIGNVDNDKDYGDDYARKILDYAQILKSNPKFSEMLFNGEFNDYLMEFAY